MTIYSTISSNKRKTWLIMFFFIIFFSTVAYVFGKALGYGLSLVGVMLIFSGFMSFLSYYYSDRIVLGLAGAHPANENNYRELYHIVENLSIASGLPMPKVYVIDDPAPNAFATGRDPKHAAVAATTGLLNKLKTAELEGVIAHEMSHVKNYDTRLMGVVSILVGFVAILSNFFFRSMWFGGFSNDEDRKDNSIFIILGIIFAILAPIVATLIQLALSRRREFLADADGALLTRYPAGLANALEKIADDRNVLRNANPAIAHFYIENPFKNAEKTSWLTSLFSTHPPIEERIKILRSM
ncbi:MAG: M48 family metallopeptidase [Patescibacteria group bacterium]|nr:M48 family metallopeptidase [Patescibacteria group bacterium]